MENKTNIAELLKDCQKGMELDCTVFDNVHYDNIDKESGTIRCYIQQKKHQTRIGFNKYGCYSEVENAKCVIFPKGKNTWEGFQRPFKDGDVVAFDNPHRDNLQVFIFKNKQENNTLSCCYLMLDGDELVLEEGMYYVTRFATEEEKEKLFQAIKKNGYKWDAETKTLEKLVPNKFDITNLKPFDKVLVRDNDEQLWTADVFGFHGNKPYAFRCVGHYTNQCVPYEGNEHLLGTNDNCDEFYKTWE